MIRNIEELLNEEFNLRHFVQHTTIDILNDDKSTKEDLIKAVMEGIKVWKMHMLCAIDEHENSMIKTNENIKMRSQEINFDYFRKGKNL